MAHEGVCLCWTTPNSKITCSKPVYVKERIGFVAANLCKEHRFEYFSQIYPNHQILEQFCQPMDMESQGFFAHTFPALRNDVEFELKIYRKYRPTPYEPKYDPVLEGVLRWRQNQPMEEPVPAAPPRMPFPEEQANTLRNAINHILAQNHPVRVLPAAYDPNQAMPYRPLVIPVAEERKLHNDSQNVHRREVIAAQSPLLFRLLAKDYKQTPFDITFTNFKRLLSRLPDPENITWYHWLGFQIQRILGVQKGLFSVEVNRRIRTYDHGIQYLNPTTYKREEIQYKSLIWAVMSAILQSPNNSVALAHRLKDEVLDGAAYCLAGSFTRILNTFTGFPEFGEDNDMRTPQEMLADAFAELSKRKDISPVEKLTQATTLLHKHKIPTEQHEVWLEPLRDD